MVCRGSAYVLETDVAGTCVISRSLSSPVSTPLLAISHPVATPATGEFIFHLLQSCTASDEIWWVPQSHAASDTICWSICMSCVSCLPVLLLVLITCPYHANIRVLQVYSAVTS